jgi:hypothetical protein
MTICTRPALLLHLAADAAPPEKLASAAIFGTVPFTGEPSCAKSGLRMRDTS